MLSLKQKSSSEYRRIYAILSILIGISIFCAGLHHLLIGNYGLLHPTSDSALSSYATEVFVPFILLKANSTKTILFVLEFSFLLIVSGFQSLFLIISITETFWLQTVKILIPTFLAYRLLATCIILPSSLGMLFYMYSLIIFWVFIWQKLDSKTSLFIRRPLFRFVYPLLTQVERFLFFLRKAGIDSLGFQIFRFLIRSLAFYGFICTSFYTDIFLFFINLIWLMYSFAKTTVVVIGKHQTEFESPQFNYILPLKSSPNTQGNLEEEFPSIALIGSKSSKAFGAVAVGATAGGVALKNHEVKQAAVRKTKKFYKEEAHQYDTEGATDAAKVSREKSVQCMLEEGDLIKQGPLEVVSHGAAEFGDALISVIKKGKKILKEIKDIED
jgi:hypothetical protein